MTLANIGNPAWQERNIGFLIMNFCVALILCVLCLRLYLCGRQLRLLSRSSGTQAYATAQIRLRMAQSVTQALVATLLLRGLASAGGHGWIEALLLVPGVVLLQWLIDLAASAFKSFALDQRFGFNRQSGWSFLSDACYALLLRALAALSLSALALLLWHGLGGWWWPPFIMAAALAAWIAGNWYRANIGPRLQRQLVLDASPLAMRVRACQERCGMADAEVVVGSGSRRSSLANAHSEQIGRRQRVVLLDTLIERLGPDQVEAVLAHELGHLARGHLNKRFVLLCGMWGIAFGIAALVAGQAYGAADYPQLAAVWLLAQPLRFLLQPLLGRSLRVWEFEADAFAARHVPPRALATGLSALFAVNAGVMCSDSWFAAFHESHPPLAERLHRLSDH